MRFRKHLSVFGTKTDFEESNLLELQNLHRVQVLKSNTGTQLRKAETYFRLLQNFFRVPIVI